jgi:hypothetical protein
MENSSLNPKSGGINRLHADTTTAHRSGSFHGNVGSANESHRGWIAQLDGQRRHHRCADRPRIDATKKQQHGPRIRPAEKCRNCGKDYPHAGGRNNCPAYGTVCRSCGKPNHWAKCCRSSSAIGPRPATTRSSHGQQPSAKCFTRNANQNRQRQHQLVNQMDNRSEQTELSDGR